MIAIIGGSGMEEAFACSRGGVTQIVSCRIGEHDVLFLARHGRHHQFSPSYVPYRANIGALKQRGVTHILATTACGSLREHIHPGDLVVLDQFIDFTHRPSTFHTSFEKGVIHPPMSDPFDESLRTVLIGAAQAFPVHNRGTIITIEGPRFSTRAESRMYQKWGADVIGMTTATECALANEAGIPYAAIAMVTDYDCWKEGTTVTIEDVFETFEKNKANVVQVLSGAVDRIYAEEHETSVAYRKYFKEKNESQSKD